MDSNKTILSIFSNAISLGSYLTAISHKIVNKNDSKLYTDFIHNTFIIPSDCIDIQSIDADESPQIYPIRDIINRIVAFLIRNSTTSNISYREQNVLTLGYRMRSVGENSRMRGQLDLECYFVNTIQTLVTTKPWQILADRVG